LRACDERGQQVRSEHIDCESLFESVDRLETRCIRTKDRCVVNDNLERSGRVGLFRKSTRLLDTGEITRQCRTRARHGAHRLLGTALVAPMLDDVMA
jgi:hypothetical protein